MEQFFTFFYTKNANLINLSAYKLIESAVTFGPRGCHCITLFLMTRAGQYQKIG